MIGNGNIYGDEARFVWTLECSQGGATPLRRVYSTMKALYSQASVADVEKIAINLLEKGIIEERSNSLHPTERLYAIRKTA